MDIFNQILSSPCGDFRTNCYILKLNFGEIIIDPGENSLNFVLQNVKNPIAILNTHGHFDHIYSNCALKKALNIPIYAPKDDVFMIENDIFNFGYEPCKVDFAILPDEKVKIGEIWAKFWHFPGHTPGCSMIEIENVLFSGDFLFKNSIGRYDFPYSNANDMQKSLQKCLQIKQDFILLPGHGEKSTLKDERPNITQMCQFAPNCDL